MSNDTNEQERQVQPIKITDELRKECTEIEIKVFEMTNYLMEQKLCGLELTLDNGWKITFKNKKFAKKIGVPM